MATGAGVATILFTDLVGSTALTDRLGDDRAEVVRRAHFQLIREAVSSSRGEEVKTLGDGHMVVFGSTLDAIGCAIAIQQAVELHNSEPGNESLQVRIGINAGEVFHDENDYFGTPVVIAKRLCDQAAGGQIVVSDLVSALVGSRGQFSFRQLGPLQLRGLSQPLPAREVVWRDGSAAAPRPASRRRWWVAVGAVLGLASLVIVGVLLRGPGHKPRPVPAGGMAPLIDTTGTVRGPEAPARSTFVGGPGDVVNVNVTRAQLNLDLFVEVLDPDGIVEAFDDDSGPGFEPGVKALRLTKAGKHQVLVYVVAPSTGGSFHLRVIPSVAGSPDTGPWYGELRAPSQQDRYPLHLRAGQHVRVRVTVDAHHHFDAVVDLYGPDGPLAVFDDDSGQYHDPEIKDHLIDRDGTWTAVVRGSGPAELGAYRLLVS